MAYHTSRAPPARSSSFVLVTKNNRPPHLLVILGVCFCVLALGIYHGHAQLAWFTDAGGTVDNNSQVLGLLFPAAPSKPIPQSSSEGHNNPSAATAVATETGRRNKVTEAETTPETSHVEDAVNGSSASVWTGDKSLDSCGNSRRWLNHQRLGNLRHDPLFTEELARKMILNLENLLTSEQRHTLLGQSICHEDGRFRNDTAAGLAFDDRTVRLWTVRLVYYAMHYHQHRLAVPEATLRYDKDNASCSHASMLEKHNVGAFDYECPQAKYIIMSLGGTGLGSNVRGAMVPAYLMGLTADRIVHFVNNAPGGDKFLKLPWLLASCPRQDYQCFFMPNSPCTLTEDEIANAHELDRQQKRMLTQLSLPVTGMARHRVWRFNSQFFPAEIIGERAIAKLQEYAQVLVNAVPHTTENANFIALLNKAVEAIASGNGRREGTYNFAARWNAVYHALTIYSMRPNPSSAAELDKIMKEIVPEDLNPESAFGLPVRASDKCHGESECLSFAEHMMALTQTWKRHLNETGGSHNPTVVFTTEAKSVVEEQQAWVKNNAQAQSLFDFDFVTNARDLLPDTGFMRHVAEKNLGMESDPDANMLSSVSSLKLQLFSRVSIGNCCSNFHAMLHDFLSEGCGAASENTFVCLQEYDDPLLRVCCGWHKECLAQKNAYRAALLSNATVEEAHRV